MIIRFEQTHHRNWHGEIGPWAVAGATRLEALTNARRCYPHLMRPFPLQPEEIPGELREIARRMAAVGGAAEYYAGFGSHGPTARQMVRWAESVAAWADTLEAQK